MHDKFKQRLASRFVEMYLEHQDTKKGRDYANAWAQQHIPKKEDRQSLKPFIKEEFNRRGYDLQPRG